MSYVPGSTLFERAYISEVSNADGRSLFLRENPRRKFNHSLTPVVTLPANDTSKSYEHRPINNETVAL